jgi:hypothetical protein
MRMAVVFMACAADIWGSVELEMIGALGDSEGCVDTGCVEGCDQAH